MVEGGSELLGSFLAARAFDQVALFRAPLLLGGRGSLPAFGGPDPARRGGGGPHDPGRAAAGPARGRGDGLFEIWRPSARPGTG